MDSLPQGKIQLPGLASDGARHRAAGVVEPDESLSAQTVQGGRIAEAFVRVSDDGAFGFLAKGRGRAVVQIMNRHVCASGKPYNYTK